MGDSSILLDSHSTSWNVQAEDSTRQPLQTTSLPKPIAAELVAVGPTVTGTTYTSWARLHLLHELLNPATEDGS